MPVRRIPRNHLVTTGRVARPNEEPAEYEGTLENDYYVLLNHDPDVLSYDPQPVRIPVSGGRHYTPDVLVHFHQPVGAPRRPSELTEIKPANLLVEKAAEFAPKFAAAEAYCKKKGWIFVKKSRDDMDLVRLKNIRMLRGFLKHPLNPGHCALIRNHLAAQDNPISIDELLSGCASQVQSTELISSVWRGVMTHDFYVDLSLPVSMTSLISEGI